MNAKQAFYLGLYDRTFGRPQGHGRQDFERWPENLQEAYVAGLDPEAKVSDACKFSQVEKPSQEAQPEKSTLSKSNVSLLQVSLVGAPRTQVVTFQLRLVEHRNTVPSILVKRLCSCDECGKVLVTLNPPDFTLQA